MIFVFLILHNATTTLIYTLSLHDALPISIGTRHRGRDRPCRKIPHCARQRSSRFAARRGAPPGPRIGRRSEEHTSELQSRLQLVCRLLLEKKKHFVHIPGLSYSGVNSPTE